MLDAQPLLIDQRCMALTFLASMPHDQQALSNQQALNDQQAATIIRTLFQTMTHKHTGNMSVGVCCAP